MKDEREEIVENIKKKMMSYKTEEGETLLPVSLELMQQINKNLLDGKRLAFALVMILLLILTFLVVIAFRWEIWTHLLQRMVCS